MQEKNRYELTTVEGSGFLNINRLRFQKWDGEWKIIHQFVEPAPAD